MAGNRGRVFQCLIGLSQGGFFWLSVSRRRQRLSLGAEINTGVRVGVSFWHECVSNHREQSRSPAANFECQLWVWRRNRINKEPKGGRQKRSTSCSGRSLVSKTTEDARVCVWSRVCEVNLMITQRTSDGILSTWVITLSRLSCSFSSDDLETFIINSPSPVPVGFRGGSPANRRRDIDLLREHSGTSILDLDET